MENTVPEKVYDMDTESWVNNPEYKAPASTETETEEEEESEEESEEGDSNKKDTEAKKSDAEEEEGEEEESEEESGEEGAEEKEEESEEGEEEEESDDDSGKKKEDETEAVSADDYISNTFGEKYGIKSETQLTEIVDKALDLMDEHEALVKERDTLKAEAGKPKFPSPAHESAYNFVSKFNPNMQGEALQTFAKLVGMDIEQADSTMILEEEFIHRNPELSRSEAQTMFKRHYAKNYTIDREKFATDEAYNDEKKYMDIQMKSDIAKARTFLKKQQEEHKPAAITEAPKTNEAVTKAVEKNAKTYGDHVAKMTEIVFEDGGSKYVYKLDAEKVKQVSAAVMNWVKNPSSYNDKGELVGASEPKDMVNTIVGGLFMNDIVKSLKSQIKNETEIKRVEDIAKIQPKKSKSPDSGEVKKGGGDEMDQSAMAIIRKKKAA